MTAKALVQGNGTTLPVEILNPTDEDVCLYKYTNLGNVTRIADSDVVCSMQTQPNENSAELQGQSDSLSPEVERIVENIDADLTKQQKFKVRQLLHKNEDVFATKDLPFGRTNSAYIFFKFCSHVHGYVFFGWAPKNFEVSTTKSRPWHS